VLELRHELETRSLSPKGLKSQLIARLTKTLRVEQEKDEETKRCDEVKCRKLAYHHHRVIGAVSVQGSFEKISF